MLPVISVETMRDSDRATIAAGTPGIELMRRAGEALFMAGERHIGWDGTVTVLSGPGNNGGDGYALACALAARGLACTVYQAAGKVSADGAAYREGAIGRSVPIVDGVPSDDVLAGSRIIVDCLLGTGFHGSLGEPYRTLVRRVNASEAYVISADINSGLSGDTGWSELAVRSQLTVAIGCLKDGMLQGDARKFIAGMLVDADIGIAPSRQENLLMRPSRYHELLDEAGLAPGIRTLSVSASMLDRGAKAAGGVMQSAMAYAGSLSHALIRVTGGPAEFFVCEGRAYFKNPGWVAEDPLYVH